MSFAVDVDRANRILRTRFSGCVTEGELRQFVLAAHEHVALTKPAAAVIDMSATTSFEVTPAFMAEMARIPPIISDPQVARFIIAPSAEIYGLSRMFEIQADAHPNLHVVRTEQEAWDILNVKNPVFEPLVLE